MSCRNSRFSGEVLVVKKILPGSEKHYPTLGSVLTGEISLDMACNKRKVQGSMLTSDLFLNIGCNKRQVQGSVLT